jgi:hypothetical protein
MKRILPPVIFVVAMVLALAVLTPRALAAAGGACPSGVSGPSSCFFIAANGSDSNDGKSESTPWLHAPGMATCTGTCAATTPAAGNGFIFRGGDTWHFGASTSPATGGEWQWTWSGSSGNCNYPVVTSSCVYIGVDVNWPAANWTRPIMNLDNPVIAKTGNADPSHPGYVTSCPHEDHTFVAVYLNASYLVFDNFEFVGKCWTQVPVYGQDTELNRNGTYIALTNSYFHGWTEAYNPQSNGSGNPMDQAPIVGGGNTGATHNVVAYNVFDGSDSTCTGGNACTGGPVIYRDAYDFHNNVVRYMSNGLNSPNNMFLIHDNLFEYMYESYDPSNHGGVVESYGSTLASGSSLSIYNNLIRHTNIGVTINPGPPNGGTLYVFNNVWWDIGNAANCLAFENNSSAHIVEYVTNNTMDYPCSVRLDAAGGPSGPNQTVNFQNNHFIGYQSATCTGTCDSPLALVFYNKASGSTVTNNGNHVFQSESTANGQGYARGNNYAPTSSAGATVGAGQNMSSNCPGYSPDSALCSATSDGVAESSDAVAVYPAIAIVPRTPDSPPSWDAGAYLFGSALNPPQNLTGNVN